MKYISRELERKFKQMNAFFKVVIVTGQGKLERPLCSNISPKAQTELM